MLDVLVDLSRDHNELKGSTLWLAAPAPPVRGVVSRGHGVEAAFAPLPLAKVCLHVLLGVEQMLQPSEEVSVAQRTSLVQVCDACHRSSDVILTK